MTVTHSKTILITGLQAAANVRKGFSQYSDRLSFAIVEDISQPGAFNEAVEGVDGIIHTASPFQTSVQDNKWDLLWPAINGTTSIFGQPRSMHRVFAVS
ncbi:hypothetical protein RU639_011579 [Aspergillus parasiticus]